MPKNSKPDVVAAGAIPWRERDGELEVLIIHRPKYDDWSWPKGKQDEGEAIPETAVREVREEVGLEIALGAPLAKTAYKVKHGLKHVHYWAAEVSPAIRAQQDGGEVDELRWVSPARARKLLTNSTDAEPLDRLVELWKDGDLRTRCLILVRHAKAKPRASWLKPEGDRPLAATGKRQAVAVGRLLECWRPAKVVSSPWLRCMQTVSGYARSAGLRVVEKNRLTEHSHARKPKKVAKFVDQAFESRDSLVFCTHRPVLPTVLEAFSTHLPKDLRRQLPTEDPYLVPGEMIVLTISRRHRDRIISLEQVKPVDS